MDAQVIKAFRDKDNTENVYQPGDKFSGTVERVQELAGGGYVVIIETPKKPVTKRKKA